MKYLLTTAAAVLIASTAAFAEERPFGQLEDDVAAGLAVQTNPETMLELKGEKVLLSKSAPTEPDVYFYPEESGYKNGTVRLATQAVFYAEEGGLFPTDRPMGGLTAVLHVTCDGDQGGIEIFEMMMLGSIGRFVYHEPKMVEAGENEDAASGGFVEDEIVKAFIKDECDWF